MTAMKLVLLVIGVTAMATAAMAQDLFMVDPRIVDDGAKASLISRTDPARANDVLRQCAATAQQVASGIRQQGQINLSFCSAFDIGIASIAGHDRRPDAGAVAQQASQRVAGYLTALGASRGQVGPAIEMLRGQVATRLRVYSPG